MERASRARSRWGWGDAEREPDRASLEALAPILRERLGFGGDEIELPAPADRVELAPPRLQPPDSLADLLSADPADRMSHAMGKAYRDVVRGFRGRYDRTPDMVARPRDADDVARVLELCSERRLAAIPYGGGSSVVGGVEPRVGHGYRGTVSVDLGLLSGVVEVDEVSRAALIRAGTLGPALEDGLRQHGLTLRHFPQSFEFSTLGGWIATRAGGHFATVETHIDDLVESVTRDHPVGPVGEPSPAGLGSGTEPGPHAARLRGDPRRDHRGLGPGQAPARSQGLAGRPLRRLPERRRGGAGARPVGPAPLELPAARSARGADHGRRRRFGCRPGARLRERLRAGRSPDGPGARVRRRPRRPARARARGRRERGGRVLALRLPRRALPARLPDLPRRDERHVRDGDHLGPLRRVPLAGDRGGAPRRRRGRGRTRRGRGGAAGHVPLHARLSGRAGSLLHGPRAGAARLRGRAVGRGQGRGLGGDHLRGRHDHPSPRGRPRPSPLVRPAAPRPVRRGPRRRQARGRPRRDPQPRGADRSGRAPRRPDPR